MRVVSFFAGCGGLDLGFSQAGFDVVWANELEPHCRATYIRNHPQTEFVLDDICNIDSDSIPDCDGFIGGPPCQSWSVGGKQKGLEDKRGQLFLKYIQLIKEKRPKFFVIENVKGMLDVKFKQVFNNFIDELKNAGYDVSWELLDAVNYRIPQNRERVFFVGFRKELNIVYKFPEPTCTEPISLNKAIGDIEVTPRYLSGKKIQENNDDFTIKKGNRILHNHDVLISKFGPFYYRGNRRRGWHQPSFTINATADYAPLHPSSPKMMYYGHENWNFQKDKLNEYRRLSVRECARIQTFPDSFIFEYENVKDAYKMIGNAVPPRLGFEIAKSILSAIGNRITNDIDFSNDNSTAQDIILVGYYKGSCHKRLILENKLYYVRADGRPGSLFKEDCQIVPRYVFMHHKKEHVFYQLNEDEPILTTGSYLKSLGFNVSGEKYLCFRLKDTLPASIGELKYDENSYSPYFTTFETLIKS